MKLIQPTAKYIQQCKDYNSHIAYCARICYASDKTTGNYEMCQRLWNNKHRSMFRHAGCYYILPSDVIFQINSSNGSYCNVVYKDTKTYISCNMQFALEHMQEYEEYRIDVETAFNNAVFYHNKMLYYTFEVETGVDITREFNRKSPNAIAEQSTRYVDFNKKLGIRFKKCHWMYNTTLYQTILYKFMCKVDELFYKIARSKYGLNLPPQDARFCLFLDTMSKAVYTYTVKEWEHFINLRLFDYTGAAHPDAKVIAQQIYDVLSEEEGYDIVNYKTLEAIHGDKCGIDYSKQISQKL